MLFATIRTFGSDALNGGSQVSLLTTTAVCIFIGITFYRIPWKDYEIAITNNIAGVSSAIIILLIIGALSGAWMISGVVPTLIYYGMKIIHPDFFLTSTCIMDHNSNHRHRSFRNRESTGIRGRLDCRSHYFRSLLWRQGFTAVRYYGACLLGD